MLQELLNSLQQTKTKSNEINESLAQKKEIERTLNKEINVYLPLAEFGSVLFFSILDVPKLNRLYKFSLSSFIHLFRKTLGIRRVSSNPAVVLEIISHTFRTCRGKRLHREKN